MITIMKTKTFLNAIDDAYAKGISAGVMAQKVQDREDQNRRLYDMYKRGKDAGYLEAFGDGIEEIDEINLEGILKEEEIDGIKEGENA